jgi:hypothetical protein
VRTPALVAMVLLEVQSKPAPTNRQLIAGSVVFRILCSETYCNRNWMVTVKCMGTGLPSSIAG